VLDLVRLGTLSCLATHDATATREDDEWAVTVHGVGTTRAGTLEGAGRVCCIDRGRGFRQASTACS
jgi:hypothetical protein